MQTSGASAPRLTHHGFRREPRRLDASHITVRDSAARVFGLVMSRTRLGIGAAAATLVVVAAFFIWHAGLAQEAKKKALEQAQQGDFWDAEPALKACLAREPSDVELLRVLAKGYLKSDRKAEAEECLTRWLAQTPREPDALLLRLDLHRKLGQVDKAVLDADRLVEIDPANPAWRDKRLTVLYEASRFAEAEEECRRGLQQRPNDVGLRRSLASIKQARGEPAEAAKILDGVLRDHPRDVGALIARGQLHLRQDEPAQAIPVLRQALDLNPGPNPRRTCLYHLAQALHAVGQNEEADRMMDEVRRMNDAAVLLADSEGQPNNVALQLRTAQAQFEVKDWARTVQILQRVLRVDPTNGRAHMLMAETLDKQGRPEQAAEHRRLAGGAP
jgi:tetratricopeptide (TPR) repeat protein